MKKGKINIYSYMVLLLAISALPSCVSKSDVRPERPNIVILFADDLGYSDIGCYGGEIETPNLDKLASEGMRFTNFMNCSKCAASRAALLTGKYPIETGCNGEPAQMINGITIAEMLSQAGYSTMMSGKWHAEEHPVKRGFDQYYGSAKGGSNYFAPTKRSRFMLNDQLINPITDENKSSYYTTDVYTDKALEYLDQTAESDNPFLLYVAYNAPHFPLQAWPEDIAKYRGKYMKGWDAIREERYKRQLELGIVKPEWKLSERDSNVPAWEDFERKDDADLTMAVYAAMVDRLDQNIGRILQKLEDLHIADNTIVLFFSDNGACAEGAMWDGVDKRTKPDTRMSQAKLGIEWANACNTPYRKFKRFMYNGGQLTPFIVRWPKEIKSKGEITHQPAHIVDLAPTFYELAELKYPVNESWKVDKESDLLTEWKIDSLSGKSMIPIFEGKAAPKRKYFLGHFQEARMIMKDNWKLVSDGSDGTVQHMYDHPWELYKIDEDATEQNNLADQYPALVEKMDADYRRWIDRADRLTGIRSHKWFQLRFSKEQQTVVDQLANDKTMQKLLKERRSIGLQIVEELEKGKYKMRTGLGMEKIPMSYFGLVNEGRTFKHKTKELKALYQQWDKNINVSADYCKSKGVTYAEVWRMQEKIRLALPADEVGNN